MELAARAQRLRGARDGRGGAVADGVEVFDRTRVVLGIFARRASSQVARLRIELAEAQRAKVRLGSSATQGISAQLRRVAEALARRVPGCDREALMERQQRIIQDDERRIKEELARLHGLRGRQRQSRRKLPTLALVGYTNVGKSAIVNRLCGSDLLVRDGVFVTLDVASRRLALPSGGECHVLDSVGFVKNMPHELCEAFQATVEELLSADLVLHVRDMSHPKRDEYAKVVTDVLEKTGIDVHNRVIEVWNKIDLISRKEARHFKFIRMKQDSATPLLLVSALRGEGLEDLLAVVERRLAELAAPAQAVGAHAAAEGPGVAAAAGAPAGRGGLERARIPGGLPAAEIAERWAFLREHGRVVEDSIAAEGDGVAVEVWLDAAA
ncbi:unnamed protein product, partial [Prorocentrum cordatum]